MLFAICRGMIFGAAFSFLLILLMSFLVEDADPLPIMLKEIGLGLMLFAASICGAINSVIYLVDNGSDKIIRKYTLGAFYNSALFSVLFLFITAEFTRNPISFIILLLVGITLAMGFVNLFFAATTHMILKITSPNQY